MFRREELARYGQGVAWMVAGSVGVFSLLHIMNADEAPPKVESKDAVAAFQVERKPPPKKKERKPPARKRRAKRARASGAPAPLLGAGLRGIGFDLPGFDAQDLGDAGKGLLGDTSKKLAMAEGAVDVMPRARRQAAPRYPKGARQRGVTGFVRLSIFVDEGGAVAKVRVLDAKPSGVFEQAATQAVQGWEFEPGQYEGSSVGTWMTQTVRFELKKS